MREVVEAGFWEFVDRVAVRIDCRISIETPRRLQEKRRNWNATDYAKLIQKIEEGLEAKTYLKQTLRKSSTNSRR